MVVLFETKYSIEALKEKEFGYLKVSGEAEPRVYYYGDRVRRARYVYCECKCGREGVLVSLNNLLRGHTRSCGCHKKKYNRQFLKGYKGDYVPGIV